MPESLVESYQQLLQRPCPVYVLGRSHLDLGMLKEVEATLDLAEKTWFLYHRSPSPFAAGVDYAQLESIFITSLDYVCRTCFDLAVGFSDPDLWIPLNKERILSSIQDKPDSARFMKKCLMYLHRILADDLRECVPNRSLYETLLKTCQLVENAAK